MCIILICVTLLHSQMNIVVAGQSSDDDIEVAS